MSVSSVAAVSPASSTSSVSTTPSSSSTAATVASPFLSSNNTASFSNLAVSLSEDAGVIATLSGGSTAAASGISAIDLYNNLANAVQPTVVGSSGTASTSSASGTAASGTSGASSGGATAAAVDVNSAWASLIQSNPSLAPLSVDLSEQQAIVNTFA